MFLSSAVLDYHGLLKSVNKRKWQLHISLHITYQHFMSTHDQKSLHAPTEKILQVNPTIHKFIYILTKKKHQQQLSSYKPIHIS